MIVTVHVRVYTSSGTFRTGATDHSTLSTGHATKLDVSYQKKEENSNTYNSSGKSNEVSWTTALSLTIF